MSHSSLRSLCTLALILTVTICGCRSGKKTQAKRIDEPKPPADSYSDRSSRIPPLPGLSDSRPQLLRRGPSSPLEPPPNRQPTSRRDRSALSGPSLPLPAPPAEDF